MCLLRLKIIQTFFVNFSDCGLSKFSDFYLNQKVWCGLSQKTIQVICLWNPVRELWIKSGILAFAVKGQTVHSVVWAACFSILFMEEKKIFQSSQCIHLLLNIGVFTFSASHFFSRGRANGYKVSRGNLRSLKNSGFDPSQPTKIIIHGYMSNYISDAIQLPKDGKSVSTIKLRNQNAAFILKLKQRSKNSW